VPLPTFCERSGITYVRGVSRFSFLLEFSRLVRLLRISPYSGHRGVAFGGRSAPGGKKTACEGRFYSVKRRNSAEPAAGKRPYRT
jgi:hypothetical protein